VRRAARSLPLRAAITLALLGVVALQIDWGAVDDRLAEGEWGWFTAAVALLLAVLVIGALRWHLLLEATGIDTSAARTLRAYAIGVFSNNFLPTSFGGDAARALIVAGGRDRLVSALTSVVVDRMSALASLIAVAWVALAASPGDVPRSLALGLLAATAAGAAAVGLLALAIRRRGRLARRLPERLRRWAGEAHATFRAYTRNRRLVAAVLALGLLFQALTTTAVWFLAKALELDLAFALVAVTVPLVLVITLMPISVAGFGVREGGFVVLLGEAGVGATDATLLSLLSVAALALSSLPGALALLLPGPKPPASTRLDGLTAKGSGGRI
jgi:uncharacterized membrane protein YbhN (UPF0104 family)